MKGKKRIKVNSNYSGRDVFNSKINFFMIKHRAAMQIYSIPCVEFGKRFYQNLLADTINYFIRFIIYYWCASVNAVNLSSITQHRV